MGQVACLAVEADPELELVAAVDPRLGGIDLRQVLGADASGVQVAASVEEIERAGVEVAVDFTVADAAVEHIRWCAEHGVHAVVGTTGIDDTVMAELRDLFASASSNCVIAPNFAVGAVLMMRFAEMAAPVMGGAEIVELHHDGKLDAPSGTAMLTARRMARARRDAQAGPWAGDRTQTEVVASARGGEVDEGVRIHSVRLPGLVAHQEVIFGAAGQSLVIRHDAYDRTSFMPGMVLAIKEVGRRSGLTVGLDALLGF